MAVGMRPKRKGLFGSTAMPAMAGPDMGAPGLGMMQQQAPEPEKPKFFGQGGAGRNIAGNIGDALMQMSNMAPIYNPAMQQRAQENAKQQMAESKRLAGREDFMFKEDYKRDNAEPGNDYTYFDDNAGNRWRQNKVTGAVDPEPTFIDKAPKQNFIPDGLGGGRFANVPNPYLQNGAAGGGQPYNPDEWEEVGGAGSNASGGF